ncbi:ankyrin repeat-containing protein ITN1-like [Vitis riparia]|uniref:ankyrin repeat-containing protein ITN1-like n=1 Tax=Vitis riparia TaxID=96939 RepID=UPI00155A47F4|nr:ankyrin repeat-containing protein ITN1-like [Vitis riparia]
MAEDPLALARASVTCFDETPLHIAAMLGHLDFAKALASHKPDMAMAVDLQGRSPLHLASANGHIEIVNMLLSLNSNICLICDEDGRTPLNLAVMKGHVEVTRELVTARPEVTEHKLDHGETILHSSVRHNRLGALKMLVESVREAEFINARDDYGNTVLHTATTLKQLETVRYLLNGNMVEVNAVNGSGLTALDVIEHMPRDLKSMEIIESLSKVGALRARNVPTNGECEITMTIEESRLDSVAQPLEGISIKKRLKNQENWLKNKREALMITASVIAAMAYQAGLNPPGSIWQDDKSDHDAGTSIMGDYCPCGYRSFWIYKHRSPCYFSKHNFFAYKWNTYEEKGFHVDSNGDYVGHNNMHGACLLDFTVGHFTVS